MTVSERVAYLKGLADGTAMSADSPEGKLFAAVIDTLQEVADELEDLTATVVELGEDIDVISDSLADVEEDLYGEEEDDEEDEEEEDDDWDEEELYAVTCPNCGAEIHIDADQLEEGEICCPSCGEELELEYDEDDEEEEEEDD